jgi:hypothetical protein
MDLLIHQLYWETGSIEILMMLIAHEQRGHRKIGTSAQSAKSDQGMGSSGALIDMAGQFGFISHRPFANIVQHPSHAQLNHRGSIEAELFAEQSTVDSGA